VECCGNSPLTLGAEVTGLLTIEINMAMACSNPGKKARTTCTTPITGSSDFMINSMDNKTVTAKPGNPLRRVKTTGPTASIWTYGDPLSIDATLKR